MKESSFWRKLRPLMKEAAPGIVVERIESWSTPGFPDVSATWDFDFWLELKIRRSGKVKYQPGQVPWLKRRWRAGSLCYALIHDEPGDMTLVQGINAKECKPYGLYSLDYKGVSAMLGRIRSDNYIKQI